MTVHAQYRQQFKNKVLDLKPASIVDVGCGNGALVQLLQKQGIDAIGVESDVSIVNALEHTNIVLGTAEKLPFADNSVDMVVSEFSLHHFEDFPVAVAECLRVAAKHVLFLDGWYDGTIESQKNAHAFDRWMKTIDRSVGEIHNDVLDAGHIYSAVSCAGVKVDFAYENWLTLTAMDTNKFNRLCDDSLAKAGNSVNSREALSHIVSEINVNGISEDGALFVSMSHCL